MNWKFKLLFLIVAVTAVAVLIKLPFQTDSSAESLKNEKAASDGQENVTTYQNGVTKIKPANFAVSGMVREMPTVDPDALVNRANFVESEKIREMRVEAKRKKSNLQSDNGDNEEINEFNNEEVKKVVPGAGAGALKAFRDSLLKDRLLPESPQTMPTPSLTFDGATQADNSAAGVGALVPPDVNGDVGPNYYVSSVNLVLKIFNKNGTIAAGPVKTSSLFAALPANDPCRIQNDGDPIVLYDSLADRWHITQFALPGTISYQCVALSVTNDPTGAYYVWSYQYPNSSVVANDYPKVGVWSDGYHMTFNQFNSNTTNNYIGVGILSQDRTKALLGDPTTSVIYINFGNVDSTAYALLPGDIDGLVAPPTGASEVFAEERADELGDPIDAVRLYKWVPNFTTPANSAFTVIGDVPLASFDAASPTGRTDIEQMGGTPLDSIAARSMHRFAYRNLGTAANPVNSYVGNFTVNVSGVAPTTAATYQAGIRWYEMRRTGDSFSIFDQGTHNLTPGDGANGLNNWMGNMAQDNRGDIALGFSQAGTTQRANIMIAGRTNNTANSGILNEGEAVMYAANGSQTGSSNRWGDYSSMSIDPTDDCTFCTQEYYATTSSSGWSSRVGKFRYPQCTDAPKATINGTVTFCSGGAPVPRAGINATGGFNRVTKADGTYSITVSPGTYTIFTNQVGLSGDSQTVTVAAGGTTTANLCLTGVAVVTSQTPQIISESCGLANGSPDPGEQLTVSLPLLNTGAAATNNLTATLQATGGVTNPSATQNYGALAPGSTAVTKNFNFTVNPNLACGSQVTLTFNITDGATNYAAVTRTYETGVTVLTTSENFDGVTAPALPSGWSNVQITGTAINWVTSTTIPNSAPNAAFADDPVTVNLSALVSPPVAIKSSGAQISFKNNYNTENTYDGMVLEYTINGGTSWTDVIAGGGSFISGGYNGTIDPNFGSPIPGRNAWTGNSNGYVNTLITLPASLNGQIVQFRWLMGSDQDTAPTGGGVRIDDVQILGSKQCNTCAALNACNFQKRFDFDGDGKADLSVYRPAGGFWFVQGSQNGFTAAQFGASADVIVPADYDGDGKTDYAVYRSGTWYIQRSTAGFTAVQFGAPDDIPQPADFDGDGKADLAVFRPSNGTWYVYNLATNQFTGTQFGTAGDKPVVGDYDGDCKADYAVYRPSSGTWFIQQSTAGFTGVQFGLSGDKPVPADYDGDKKTDIAVFRPSNGTWYLQQSTAGFTGLQFGLSSDLPTPADYDGDGKADIAVFRSGTWYLQRSTAGFTGVQFGQAADKPAPNAFIP